MSSDSQTLKPDSWTESRLLVYDNLKRLNGGLKELNDQFTSFRIDIPQQVREGLDKVQNAINAIAEKMEAEFSGKLESAVRTKNQQVAAALRRIDSLERYGLVADTKAKIKERFLTLAIGAASGGGFAGILKLIAWLAGG